MTDETNWLEWAFKACVGLGGTVLLAAARFTHGKIEGVEARQTQAEKALLQQLIDCDRVYAKQADVQQMMLRFEAMLLEMRGDIKTLIRNGGDGQNH